MSVRLAAAIGLAMAVCSPAAQKKPPVTRAAADRFLTGRPFSLDDVLTALPIPAPRLVRAIEARGIAFEANREAIEKLRAARASTAVIDAIQRLSPAAAEPAKPAPAAPKTGAVAVSCAPAECEIVVDGKARGETKGGRLDVSGVKLGPVAVDFRKPGYVSTQTPVMIAAERVAAASVTLEPDLATKQTFGAQLLDKIERALGGEALKGALSFEASGAAVVRRAGGQERTWKVLERAALPAQVLFRFTDGRLQHEFTIVNQLSATNGKLRGAEADEIDRLMRLYLEHYLPAFFAKLRAEQPKLIANRVDPAPGQDYFLTAETSGAKYTISLDLDARPQVIRLESSHVDRNGMQWSFGEYAATAGAMLPRLYSLQVAPGGPGVEVRVEGYTLATFKDADFKFGRKSILGLFGR